MHSANWDGFVAEAEQLVASLGPPAQALVKLGESGWHHSFTLSDGTSVNGGKSPAILQAEFDAVFAPIVLDGLTVLDVGAWNGAFSFEAKRRGAASVLATDMFT